MQGEIMKFNLMILGLFSISLFVSCQNNNDHDWYENTYAISSNAPDTIDNNTEIMITIYYPTGCNSLDKITPQYVNDTIRFEVVFHFHYEDGVPCAHGPGYTDNPVRLNCNETGLKYMEFIDTANVNNKIYHQIYIK
jgi:hypothetical protein